jgi:hypothetical protein
MADIGRFGAFTPLLRVSFGGERQGLGKPVSQISHKHIQTNSGLKDLIPPKVSGHQESVMPIGYVVKLMEGEIWRR